MIAMGAECFVSWRGCGDKALAVLRTPTCLNPLVNLRRLELPEPPDFVRGHPLPVDPLVYRIPVDPQVSGNLPDGQPSFLFLHGLLPQRSADSRYHGFKVRSM